MKVCETCELRGYSRELCVVHMRHCHVEREPRPAPRALKLVSQVAGGVAVSVVLALLVATASSFVGGNALCQRLLPVLVLASSLMGAAYGLARGISVTGGGRARPLGDRGKLRRGPPKPDRILGCVMGMGPLFAVRPPNAAAVREVESDPMTTT